MRIGELLKGSMTQAQRFNGCLSHYRGRTRLPVDESNLPHRRPGTHAGDTQIDTIIGGQLHAGLPARDKPQRITGLTFTNKTMSRLERVQGHRASQGMALVVCQMRGPQQVALLIFCLERWQEPL